VKATNDLVVGVVADGRAEEADDACLVTRAQADPRAFAPLYDRYIDPVYRYCDRRLGNLAAAEDATSATFEKAFTALPRFDPSGGSFRGWLFTIAHNVVLNHLQQNARRGDRPLDAAAGMADDSPSPEATAVANDEQIALQAALARLTKEQRQVIELRLAGLTGLEIASALRIKHAAVRTAQHRALLRLRALLNVESAGSTPDTQPNESNNSG
jgi:RNA polymerase sigma-70 factor, ECF subfamily